MLFPQATSLQDARGTLGAIPTSGAGSELRGRDPRGAFRQLSFRVIGSTVHPFRTWRCRQEREIRQLLFTGLGVA